MWARWYLFHPADERGAVLSAAPDARRPTREVGLESDEARALLEHGRASGTLDADELALALDGG